MTLKEAVETDIDLDVHNFSDRQKQAVTKLLETCQLVLGAGLVEDKTVDDEFKSWAVATWNACNEVNQIARVKWLQEKFENLPDIIFDCLDCDCVDAQLQNGDVAEASEYIAKAIRQHFERGEL